MTKLIKEKINTIINTISSKKEVIQNTTILSNEHRIEHSKKSGSDEYGYVSRMENL